MQLNIFIFIYIYIYIVSTPPKQNNWRMYFVRRVGNHVCAVHDTEKAIFRSVRFEADEDTLCHSPARTYAGCLSCCNGVWHQKGHCEKFHELRYLSEVFPVHWETNLRRRSCKYVTTKNTLCKGPDWPVTPKGRIVYSLIVKPISSAWALMFLLNISLPVKYSTPQ